jgi:methylase of polypeptide subunit release factors
MAKVSYNERSWAIDLITEINLWSTARDVLIKRAGGENTLKGSGGSLFPDVLIFGDEKKGNVLQGWELKMPDTPIDDADLISNAKKKAELLSLNSFLVWNVSAAVLYKIQEDGTEVKVKTWNDLAHVQRRDEVQDNSDAIKKQLHIILEDLNTFIQSGEIKSSSIIEVLDSEQVAEFIQTNLGIYVGELKKEIEKNTNLEQEVNLWWRYAKNDYPEEGDKYLVLARNNLIYLVNKFLFAHILKSYQKEAALVDDINENVSLSAGLDIFNAITAKVDFWNIFQAQTAEKSIPDEVWSNLVDFNLFLKSFNFQNIDRGLLHDLIDRMIYKNKRKFAGQFTTPSELALLLVELGLKNKAGHVIDPCCGSGTIIREVFLEKKNAIGIKKALETTWGSDKFALPLQMAMFNMADPEGMGEVVQIFKEDATQLKFDQEIALKDPFNGNEVKRKIPQFDLIVSNLPFVQQEDVEVLNPDIDRINTFITEKAGSDGQLDGRSDLYAYLPFYFWNLLAENGRAAFIVSNSWLGTKWGEKFYDALRFFYHIETVVTSGEGRWFEDAKVVTNLIVLRKKSNADEDTAEATKFVVTKLPVEGFSEDYVKELVAVASLKDTVSERDLSVNTYKNEEILKIRERGFNLNSFFTDNGWILDFSGLMVKASSLFDIARGERRGWDPLFYPEAGNRIENEYLKPVLKTPRSITSLITTADATAFCCTESLDELKDARHNGALGWIKKFEDQKNEKGEPLPSALKANRPHWYSMEPSTMGEIVTGINFGQRLFFARFNEPTFVNQRLIRFTRKATTTDLRFCHALLNSIVGLFYIEALGTGRGEGALDLSKDKIEKDFWMLNPDQFTTKQKEDILSKFEKLEEREIFPIEVELEKDDRSQFDDAMLAAIGKSEYKERIKIALLNLFSIRNSVSK